MQTINSNTIHEKVKGCLGDRKLTFPIPINQIAAEKGFTVKYFDPDNDHDLEKLSGAINYDKRVIWVNAKEVSTRQRFTIAHELGHAMLHPEENILDHRLDGDFSQKELDANEFAANILMPEAEVKKVKKSLEQRQEQSILSSLTQYFDVSMQAMMLRLKELGI